MCNQIYLYCLAVAANKFDIAVHAPMLMSTHEHLICSDPLGNHCRFTHKFHRDVANAMKVYRKWEGPIWDDRPPNVVELLTAEAIVQETAYALINPVKEGLVKHQNEWPGVTVKVDDIGVTTLRIRRPKLYFDADNPNWPEIAELPITTPPGFETSEFQQLLREEVRERRREALKQVRAKGWRILGKHRVLSMSPYKRAKSFFEFGARTPTLAAGRGQKKLLQLAIEQLRLFRRVYRDAIERYKAGLADVRFPEGTWWMKVFHRVDTEPICI